MNENSYRKIFEEIYARIETASKTPLTVVVCGPSGRKSRGRLREAVRRSLKTDRVIFLEDLVKSPEGQETIRSLEERIRRPVDLDQKESLILRASTIDKDVHIVQGAGAIAELVRFEADTDIVKKMYAFVNARHRNKASFLNQGVYPRLNRAGRLFWFENEADLKSQVKSALNRNRISKSGVL